MGSAIGLQAIVRGARRMRAAQARRSWQAAEAEVLSTELDDSAGREFHIEYRYSVAGQEFTNDEILPGCDAVPAPESEDLFHHYSQRRHTIILFDPHDPSQSALQAGTDDLVWGPLVSGAFVLAACVLWACAVLAGWI